MSRNVIVWDGLGVYPGTHNLHARILQFNIFSIRLITCDGNHMEQNHTGGDTPATTAATTTTKQTSTALFILERVLTLSEMLE